MFKARVVLCDGLFSGDPGGEEIADAEIAQFEAERFIDVYEAVAAVERWIVAHRGYITQGDTVYRTWPSIIDDAPNWALVSEENVELTGIIWVEEER
jgi:hypothetical protein